MLRSPDPAATRALVVDDDLKSRRMIVKLLERKGFTCSSAASVAEAQGLLRDQKYGLLITDMRMWGEEGMDLLRFASERYPDMAAIMVSGLGDHKLEQQALRAGADFFVPKPFSLDEIREKIDAAMEKRQEKIELRSHLDH